MSGKGAKVGLSADLFDTNGRPMFGDAPLSLLSDAGLVWSVLPLAAGQLPPTAFTDYEALLIGGSRVAEKELALEGGKLRVIARNGVGYDAVDTAALTRRGILLTNTPIPVRNAVATTAVALLLALTLRLPLKSRLAREGRWRERGNYPGLALPGRALGRELVRLMQPYGMVVLAADPHVDSASAAQAGATRCSLEKLLERSDVVVVACLLNESTRHLLNKDRLRLMKPTAYLINVARGPIIDEAALIAALREGRIAGAGLDVLAARSCEPASDDGDRDTDRPLPVLDRLFR
jgi:phosphoglycerate dehydrogenase-like enzyme